MKHKKEKKKKMSASCSCHQRGSRATQQQMLRPEQVENVTDMADVSLEFKGNCSQMHTINVLLERTITITQQQQLSRHQVYWIHSQNFALPLFGDRNEPDCGHSLLVCFMFVWNKFTAVPGRSCFDIALLYYLW